MRVCAQQRVILGPPGCGKTTTLIHKLEGVLAEGIPPERVAYVSFTRKAVTEARDRAVAKFGLKASRFVYFKTIHSLCYTGLGLRNSDVFGYEHMTEIGGHIGVDFKGGKVDESTGMVIGGGDGDQHLFLSTLARARCVPLRQQWEQANSDIDFWAVERTVRAVEEYKERRTLLDFTDMLERYARTGAPLDIDVAFIDEAQDLSLLQWRVLQRMLGQARTVYIAGDDDQAIYRWSGADVDTFLSLEGERQVLDQSWRCPAAVHEVAANVVRRIGKRFDKNWKPKPGARGDVLNVRSLDEFDVTQFDGSTLLLARNTYLLNQYAADLRRRGVLYQYSHGGSSVRPAHARAIVAWERMRKGAAITGEEVRAIYEQLTVAMSVKRGYKSCKDITDRDTYTGARLRESFGLMAPDIPWYDALDGLALSDRLYYRSILRSGVKINSKPRFTLNTVHGVKGGEADTVVVVPDMAAKTFREYQQQPDDEHRVAYVAVSRAKERLVLVGATGPAAYPYPGGSL